MFRGCTDLSIAKMPAEVRHNKFHSAAASSTSSEHTTVAAAQECHSALHLYANNCQTSSVTRAAAGTEQRPH